MQGLELCRGFYQDCGAPMLAEQFPELAPRLAAGLMGSGSECFGFDDEISRDHDFEPGFCLFVPDELADRRTLFLLERAYARLPREYGGFRRAAVAPAGGARHGVFTNSGFFRRYLGREALTELRHWFAVPESALAEATNGELFCEGDGSFAAARRALLCMPEDVRRKKLAGRLLLMAQSGQYNYQRCLAHGESAAAQLAAAEFVRHTLAAVFLLNDRYQPFYKWSFRALRSLPLLSHLAAPLERLLSTGSEGTLAEEKAETMEHIAGEIIAVLEQQDLSHAAGNYLEPHAYAVNETVSDLSLRHEHILYGV